MVHLELSSVDILAVRTVTHWQWVRCHTPPDTHKHTHHVKHFGCLEKRCINAMHYILLFYFLPTNVLIVSCFGQMVG